MPEPPEDLAAIEAALNAHVAADLPVTRRMDHRRRTGRAAGAGQDDEGEAAGRPGPGPAGADRRRATRPSTSSPAAAPMSARPARSGRCALGKIEKKGRREPAGLIWPRRLRSRPGAAFVRRGRLRRLVGVGIRWVDLSVRPRLSHLALRGDSTRHDRRPWRSTARGSPKARSTPTPPSGWRSRSCSSSHMRLADYNPAKPKSVGFGLLRLGPRAASRTARSPASTSTAASGAASRC